MSDDFLFIDDGYSGSDLDRPSVTRLRRSIRAGEIDCVVVMRIDRLSRNIVDAVDLVLKEWAGRCYLRSVTESFVDTTTELGRLLFGLLAMFADFERTRIRDRTHSGKMRRIREGEQMHGRPCFGYGPHPDRKGQWVEDPGEAPLVRRLFQLASEGMSGNQLARLLNSEGIRTRNGREWHSQQILWILHNRTYIGEVEYGRSSVVRAEDGDGIPAQDSFSKRSRNPRKRRILHAMPKIAGPTQAVPPLVDSQSFELVQAVVNSNRLRRAEVGSRAFGSPHLLVGLAKCPCGSPLLHMGTGRRNPNFAGYYLCGRHRQGTCKMSGYIPAQVADTMVEREFLALFGIRELREQRLRPRTARINDQSRALEAALDQIKVESNKLEEEDRRLLRAARAGQVPFEDLADLRESLRHDRQELAERQRVMEGRVAELQLQARSLDATLAALDAVERWSDLPVWQRRQVIRMVLEDRIVLTKEPATADVRIEAPWLMG